MYDPATPTFVIRLAEVESRTIGDLAVEREDILRDLDTNLRRLVEVDSALARRHAQAQPIPISSTLPQCSLTKHPCGTDTVAAGHTCPDPANGFRCKSVGRTANNDFWDCRHAAEAAAAR